MVFATKKRQKRQKKREKNMIVDVNNALSQNSRPKQVRLCVCDNKKDKENKKKTKWTS